MTGRPIPWAVSIPILPTHPRPHLCSDCLFLRRPSPSDPSECVEQHARAPPRARARVIVSSGAPDRSVQTVLRGASVAVPVV